MMDRVWWTGKQLVVMDITELLENSVVKKIKQEQGERRACVCKRRDGKTFCGPDSRGRQRATAER